MNQKEYIENLQKPINRIIGAESILKSRKKTNEDIQREIFIDIIPLLEHVNHKNNMLYQDYGIDVSRYEDTLFRIIDGLIYMHFGNEIGDLIMFYVYDRIKLDGTINPIVDDNDNIIQLNRVEDLWGLIKHIKSLNKIKK